MTDTPPARPCRRRGQVGGDVGWLYAFNTLGSVLGCLLASALILRYAGPFGLPVSNHAGYQVCLGPGQGYRFAFRY